MIRYNPFWDMMKKKNISTYKLEHEYKMSKSMINKLRRNKSITMLSLNSLCIKFECGVSDIIEFVESEDDEKEKNSNKEK